MEWTLWTSCPVSCGGGTQSRLRVCLGPFAGGLPCTGPARDEKDCNITPCPGQYLKYSTVQSRLRVCLGPFAGGLPCTGPARDEKDCNITPCPGQYLQHYTVFRLVTVILHNIHDNNCIITPCSGQ